MGVKSFVLCALLSAMLDPHLSQSAEGVVACDSCYEALLKQFKESSQHMSMDITRGLLTDLNQVLSSDDHPLFEANGNMGKVCDAVRDMKDGCTVKNCTDTEAFKQAYSSMMAFCVKFQQGISKSAHCLKQIQDDWRVQCHNLADRVTAAHLTYSGKPNRKPDTAEVKEFKAYCSDLVHLAKCEHRILNKTCEEDQHSHRDLLMRWRFEQSKNAINYIYEATNKELPRDCMMLHKTIQFYSRDSTTGSETGKGSEFHNLLNSVTTLTPPPTTTISTTTTTVTQEPTTTTEKTTTKAPSPKPTPHKPFKHPENVAVTAKPEAQKKPRPGPDPDQDYTKPDPFAKGSSGLAGSVLLMVLCVSVMLM